MSGTPLVDWCVMNSEQKGYWEGALWEEAGTAHVSQLPDCHR